MPEIRCGNPRCRKPFDRPKGSKSNYHSPSCKHDADLARRRARHGSQRTIPRQADFRCDDCNVKFSYLDMREHEECHNVVPIMPEAIQLSALHDSREGCPECGGLVAARGDVMDGYVPDGIYCSEPCWLAYWRRELNLPISFTAEDVAHSQQYAVANGLSGSLPYADFGELFGTLDDPKAGFQLATRDDFGSGAEPCP